MLYEFKILSLYQKIATLGLLYAIRSSSLALSEGRFRYQFIQSLNRGWMLES